MDSPAHLPTSETAPFWTDEKHVHFLNSMEASFVRTMLENNHGASRLYHHYHVRLDRHLPDSSESTLDLKPHRRCRTRKHHAPSDSDSMGPKAKMEGRSRRRRSSISQPCNSSQDQVVPHIENGTEGAACNGDDDKRAEK